MKTISTLVATLFAAVSLNAVAQPAPAPAKAPEAPKAFVPAPAKATPAVPASPAAPASKVESKATPANAVGTK